MQALFPVVMYGAIGLFVLVGVLSMLTRRNLHDQIGQGGLDIGEERFGEGLPFGPGAADRRAAGGPGGEGGVDGGLWSSDERQLEIRQMLTARSDRLVRQGRAPLDIEAELARIDGGHDPTADSHDAALAEEVRQLVRARNERRARQGLEMLDVEAEVRRTLTELSP